MYIDQLNEGFILKICGPIIENEQVSAGYYCVMHHYKLLFTTHLIFFLIFFQYV